MEELCAEDGGIKAYEKVTLPASDFSNVGQPLARYERNAKSREEIFCLDYWYVTEEKYIVKVGKMIPRTNAYRALRQFEAALKRLADSQSLATLFQGDGHAPQRLATDPLDAG